MSGKKRRALTYHQGGQSPRLDPVVDMIQNSPGLSLDLDVVANILPVEDGLLLLDLRRATTLVIISALHGCLFIPRRQGPRFFVSRVWLVGCWW